MIRSRPPRFAPEAGAPSANGPGAIVIGGSITGLLAARALLNHFDRVTILERDHFPQGSGPRKGTPQARFIHVLLVRGQRILEEYFPGIDAELESAGAPCIDWTADLLWHSETGWANRFPSGRTSRNCSRDLLDWTIRRRLAADPRVDFQEGCEVIGLLSERGRSRVTGVRIRRRRGSTSGLLEETLPASLVVDASGRSSRAPEWLEALGIPAPEETTVNAYLGYATRWFCPPPGFRGDWKILMIRSQPPHNSRGGVISQVEGGRWIVGLSGVGKDYPPTDETAFLEFARSLADPILYELIKDAEPVSSIHGYRRTENRLRHYERLPGWPEGFVALGDAVCAFNPVYGQGMTVAALGASALDHCLAAQGIDRPGMARGFQRRLAKINKTPWLMATGEDFRWPITEGSRPGPASHLIHSYMDRVILLAARKPEVQLRFLEVAHLLRPPAELFQPALALQVLNQWREGAGLNAG
jgi:2-polyprenyl-6-methoxyphenol hydroxylase-like FAD-dependent oxidoreductase